MIHKVFTAIKSTIPVAFIAAHLVSCNAPVASGGTGVGNGITGRVSHRDGTPAVGATVLIRPDYYVQDTTGIPASPSTGVIVNASTDSSGEFRVDSLQQGNYSIEVFDSDSSLGTLYRIYHSGNGTDELDPRVLTPLKTLTGDIVISGLPQNAWVQMYGIEKLGKTDELGQFTITELPLGDCEDNECEFKLRILIEQNGTVTATDYQLDIEWNTSGNIVEVELELGEENK